MRISSTEVLRLTDGIPDTVRFHVENISAHKVVYGVFHLSLDDDQVISGWKVTRG